MNAHAIVSAEYQVMNAELCTCTTVYRMIFVEKNRVRENNFSTIQCHKND